MAARGDECSIIARTGVSKCNWTEVDSEVIQLGEVESSQNERRPIPMPFFHQNETRKDASKTLYAKMQMPNQVRPTQCMSSMSTTAKTENHELTLDAVDNDLLSNPVLIPSDLRSLNTSKGTLTATCGESGNLSWSRGGRSLERHDRRGERSEGRDAGIGEGPVARGQAD
jgi:hypothetical protein